MPNLKFYFFHHICGARQSLVRALPLGDGPSPCSLTYLSKPAGEDKGRAVYHPANLYHSTISLGDGRQQLQKLIQL